RAKERLLITHCRYRHTYGHMNDQLRSRFIKDIPTPLLNSHDVSQIRPQQIQLLFDEWFAINENKSTQPQPIKLEKKSIPIKMKPATTTWVKNQTAEHKTFGIGIIKNIEKRDDTTFLEVQFKKGTKKIAEKFLK